MLTAIVVVIVCDINTKTTTQQSITILSPPTAMTQTGVQHVNALVINGIKYSLNIQYSDNTVQNLKQKRVINAHIA